MTIILFSQGQVFLTFRYEVNLTGTLEMVGKIVFCCCLPQSMPETVKKTESHPTFGDVITSRQIKNEFFCAACQGRVVNFKSFFLKLTQRSSDSNLAQENSLNLQLWVKLIK